MLMSKVRKGDENALAELVEEYRDPIRRVARRLLGKALRPHLDSVDMVQLIHEALLLCVRNQKIELSSPENLLAFAMTLLRRKIAFYWRKIKHQPGLEHSKCLDQEVGEGSPVDAFAFSEEVENLLRRLDPMDRKLLELRLDGCTTAEAGRILGIDPSVLRVRLGRLRKRLHDCGIVDGHSLK